MKGIRFGAAMLSLVALAAAGCGEFLTNAELTQTAEPAAAAPSETATATPATEATATPAVEPATPAPLPGSSDEPTNVPARARLTAPASAADPMLLGGYTYVDARPAGGKLLAFIDGQECGEGQSGVFAPGEEATFAARIASAAERAGCGVPGATVSFMLNGQVLDQTVAWEPGFQEGTVDLSAGPAFAIYRGTFSLVAGFRQLLPGAGPALLVTPYIDGLACGDLADAGIDIGDHARFLYRVVVLPAELQSGCGRSGVSVVIRLQVEGGPTVDLATMPWQTLPVVPVPNVDLRNVVPRPPTEAAQ